MFQQQALQGAILQMVNHGLITGGLFLLVGVIYERTHDRTIAKMGGLASKTPVYAAAFGFFVFASVGLPGLSGFVGEFLTLVGTFVMIPSAAAIATFVMILAAGYLLWMFQRVVFGELSDFLKGLGGHLTDMRPVEAMTLVPLGALVVILGLFPGLVLGLDQRRRWTAPSRPSSTRPRSRSGRGGRRPMTTDDLVAFSPFIATILVAAAILFTDFIFPGRKGPALAVAFLGLGIVALLAALVGQDPLPKLAFNGAYVVDALTTFLDILFVSIVALTIAFAPDYLEERDLPVAEFAAILVFAMSGAMLIAGSADLLLLFLGLELMVLPGYVMAGYHKSDGYSTEGAIKYFLLGSFSSAILLFGLAFVWGMTGTTRIAGVSEALTQVVSGGAPLAPALGLGLAFMTTGVAFKIAAVPFHYWTPDAYQGSPTPVTGYLSVGPKIGAFALIIRLFADALGPLAADWNAVIMILAALTMTLGNLVALTQDNVKRMLAYSSIAHTGYMLVGFAAFGAGAAAGHVRPAVLRRGVCVHEPRRVRGHRGDPEAAGRDQQPVDVLRADPPGADARPADDAVPAVADGDPTDGGLLRQVLRDPRRRRGRWLAQRPRRARRPQRRDRRLLLPARRRLHVHARAHDRAARPAPRPPGLDRPRRRDTDDDRARPVPDHDARHCRPRRRGGRRDRRLVGPSVTPRPAPRLHDRS